MSHPTDVAASAPGLEYTFGNVLRAAWRQFARHWGAALGFGLLLLLTFAGISVPLLIATGLLIWLAQGLATIPVTLLMGAVAQALRYALLQGYLWCVIRSFDRGRLIWGDVWQAWRSPWRWPLMLLGLILFALDAMANLVDARMISPGLSSLPGGGGFMSDLFDVGLLSTGLRLVLGVCTLLVGPILLASRKPRLRAAVGEHLRILRNQPRRVVGVALLPLVGVLVMAAPAVYGLLAMRYGPGLSPEWPALILKLIGMMITGVLWVFYQFIVAALWRSAYGLPLAPENAGATPYHGVISGAIKPGSPIPTRYRTRLVAKTFDPGDYFPSQPDGPPLTEATGPAAPPPPAPPGSPRAAPLPPGPTDGQQDGH